MQSHKVLGKDANIPRALAERRQAKLVGANPVVEVGPELAITDR